MQRASLASLLAVAVACGGGSSATTPPVTTPPDDGRGVFTLQGAGYEASTRNVANASGNLVFCRREDPLPNTLWVRLAAGAAGNGEQTPHVDIDLCNFTGTSTYAALHDTSGARTCSAGLTTGVWWHDGGREFATTPDSGPCTVSVTRNATTIDGTFDCRGLRARDGSGALLDVQSGTFHCAF